MTTEPTVYCSAILVNPNPTQARVETRTIFSHAVSRGLSVTAVDLDGATCRFAPRPTHRSIPTDTVRRCAMVSPLRVFALSASLLALVMLHLDEATAERPMFANLATSRTVGTSLASTTVQDWQYSVYFEWSDCSDTPPLLAAAAECSLYSSDGDLCALFTPYGFSASGSSDPIDLYYYEGCTDDWTSVIDKLYGDQVYFRRDYYSDANCSELYGSNVLVADGQCHTHYSTDSSTGYAVVESVIATINANGSATMSIYNTTDCSGEPGFVAAATAGLLSSGACYNDGHVTYTNAFSLSDSESSGGDVESTTDDEDARDTAAVGDEDTSDGGLSTGAIVGIVVGAVVVLALVAVLVVWRRRKNNGDSYREMPAGAAQQG